MANHISRETFEQMDQDSKLNVLFDVWTDLSSKFDRKFRIDTTIATVAGFFGGVIAHLGQLTLFGHKG